MLKTLLKAFLYTAKIDLPLLNAAGIATQFTKMLN